jgi:serine/threonine protein kinase
MAITNPAEKIRFDPIDNPDCLQTMRLCLQRDYKKRPSVVELLKHQYVNKRQTQDAQVKIIMFYLFFNLKFIVVIFNFAENIIITSQSKIDRSRPAET